MSTSRRIHRRTSLRPLPTAGSNALARAPVGADDRPVANLVIGVQAIQKASAGGHTLRFRTRSTMAVGEALIMNLPHEPLVDIVPRAIGCRTWPYAAASAGLEPWASIAGSSGRQPI